MELLLFFLLILISLDIVNCGFIYFVFVYCECVANWNCSEVNCEVRVVEFWISEFGEKINFQMKCDTVNQ